MTQFSLEEIITSDNLVHQGIFHLPKNPGKKAIVWVHGLTSKFYSDPKLMELFANMSDEQGIGFASFHTRGHDYVTSTHRLDSANEKGYVHETIGSGVENFTDCIKEYDAMVSFFVHRGYSSVTLVGHSTGANKVCYYAGTVPDDRVSGVVLAGPMSDRYSAGFDEAINREHQRIMEQKIREGKGDELLTGFAFFPPSSQAWMSLLGKGSPEDVFNYRDEIGALSTFGAIKSPLLVIFAGNDEHADQPITTIRKSFDAHAASSVYKSVIINDADHGFTGKEAEFVSEIVSWVTTSSL